METETKRLLLTKGLAFAVHFERFSREMGIPAGDLAQMILHAKRSGHRYAANDSEGERRHGQAVEDIAAAHGCKVDWPGLWPCIERIGEPRSNQLLPCD